MRTVIETLYAPDGTIVGTRTVDLPDEVPSLADVVEQIDAKVTILTGELLGGAG